MKVRNMNSGKGNTIANQFIIYDGENTFFQSYNSVIVKEVRANGTKEVYLDENYWDYSKTTGKYRNQFLGETRKETLKKINDGTYKLADLNK